MALFKRRRTRLPYQAQRWLRKIPMQFRDDGCSNSPDVWCGFDLRWCCRIHDWGYCSRAHHPLTMSPEHKAQMDLVLCQMLHLALPFRWRWLGHLYRAMVRWKGHGSYDTCRGDAPKGATLAQLEIGHCRHGLRKNAAGGGSDASFKQPRPYAHTASGTMPGGAGQPK